jgi:transcription antitermination factor NusG
VGGTSNSAAVGLLDAGPLHAVDQPWHAIWTRSRHEPQVHRELTAKGIEVFFPTCLKVSKWTDRTKKIEWPLFPGYCFARFERSHHARVLASTGVVTVLSNGGVPVPVPAFEIEALQRMVASGIAFDPYTQLAIGAKVRVLTGPLAGIVGRLERKGAQEQLILAVEVLNSGARVTVKAWDVEAL